MEKPLYDSNNKLGVMSYLISSGFFATLLGSYIVLIFISTNESLRNESILTSITSFIGLLISVFGLYNGLKKRAIHSFLVTGLLLALLTLNGLFRNIIPALSDASASLSPWGIAAVTCFSVLFINGVIALLLPRKHLFVRKMMLILSMTILVAIDGITFVSDVISLVQTGAAKGQIALLSLLSAYTNLAPIVILGFLIGYLLDVHFKNEVVEKKD